MRMLVIGILTGVRERWETMNDQDKLKTVSHMRAIANVIEKSVANKTKP